MTCFCHHLPCVSGGVCQTCWANWRDRGADPWVISVVRKGYREPFKDPPPLSQHPIPFSSHQPGSQKACTLQDEIPKMLEKGALEEIPDPGPGIFLPSFPCHQGH